MRQRDSSRVPIIKLYRDEIAIFLQIQGSCGLGEQNMGLGTRVQTPCQGKWGHGEDRDPVPAPQHPIPTFPRLCKQSTEGSLCNGSSLIILNQPTQCKISLSTALLHNITTTPV